MSTETLRSLDAHTVITLCAREAATRAGISEPLSVALLTTAQALHLEVGLLRSAWPSDTPDLDINDRQQLEALPPGAVVLDKEGDAYIRSHLDGWEDGRGGCDTETLLLQDPLRLLHLPPTGAA